jgi:hypothetical protein
MTERQCEICGRLVDDHDRNVRFRLPDPVLAHPQQERAPGSWLSHGSAEPSVMMQIPGIGAFVRALLAVKLTGGHTVTYGVWTGIAPQDLQRAFQTWWQPEYQDLRLEGLLANSVQPWGMLAAPVTLAVRDREQTPYCERSTDPVLSQVLSKEWPHEEVLQGLP